MIFTAVCPKCNFINLGQAPKGDCSNCTYILPEEFFLADGYSIEVADLVDKDELTRYDIEYALASLVYLNDMNCSLAVKLGKSLDKISRLQNRLDFFIRKTLIKE